jgi:quercetin dioxygenase-like cupin family protein
MKLVRIDDVADEGRDVSARPLLEGEQSNVRIIRLSAGKDLPPHRHGHSDLMLYVAQGEGELHTAEGVKTFAAGALAFYSGDEELRVRNTGASHMTMLAFLAPKFAAE